jgi:hypothetical protein
MLHRPGRPFGDWGAPAAGPLPTASRVRAARQPAGRRARSHHAAVSHRAGPAPRANKQRVAWQRPPPARPVQTRVRVSSRDERYRGFREPSGRPQTRGSD